MVTEQRFFLPIYQDKMVYVVCCVCTYSVNINTLSKAVILIYSICKDLLLQKKPKKLTQNKKIPIWLKVKMNKLPS